MTELRKAEEDVRRKVRERAARHDLPMKISDAEWQWDRKKLTVYFTAENRVDFRELVRDLATLFRTHCHSATEKSSLLRTKRPH